MATKLTKLLKRDVVAVREGRSLGTPHSVLIDPDQHRVAAIVMVASHVPELSVVARARSVLSFDSDTIAIEALTSLRIAAHDEMVLDLLSRGVEFQGRPVLSSEGAKLGRIKDVIVDESGDVTEYWIRKRRLGFFRRSLRVSPDVLRAPAGGSAVVNHEALTTDTKEEPPPALESVERMAPRDVSDGTEDA